MTSSRSATTLRSLTLTTLLVVSVLTATASSAFAAVSCTQRIKAVQTESSGKVLVKFPDSTWHVVAGSSHPARSERLSMAMAAYLSGKELYLRYDSGSCSQTDYSQEATKVRITD